MMTYLNILSKIGSFRSIFKEVCGLDPQFHRILLFQGSICISVPKIINSCPLKNVCFPPAICRYLLLTHSFCPFIPMLHLFYPSNFTFPLIFPASFSFTFVPFFSSLFSYFCLKWCQPILPSPPGCGEGGFIIHNYTYTPLSYFVKSVLYR